MLGNGRAGLFARNPGGRARLSRNSLIKFTNIGLGFVALARGRGLQRNRGECGKDGRLKNLRAAVRRPHRGPPATAAPFNHLRNEKH